MALSSSSRTQAPATAAARHLTIVTNNLRIPTALPPSAVRDVYLLGGSCRLASHVAAGGARYVDMAGVSCTRERGRVGHGAPAGRFC